MVPFSDLCLSYLSIPLSLLKSPHVVIELCLWTNRSFIIHSERQSLVFASVHQSVTVTRSEIFTINTRWHPYLEKQMDIFLSSLVNIYRCFLLWDWNHHALLVKYNTKVIFNKESRYNKVFKKSHTYKLTLLSHSHAVQFLLK